MPRMIISASITPISATRTRGMWAARSLFTAWTSITIRASRTFGILRRHGVSRGSRAIPHPLPPPLPSLPAALAQDVAGIGGYAMWDDHLYVDGTIYRSDHVGASQPNPGSGAYNIRGVAPYWRVAWQQLTPKTQYEFGAYGMHMASTPGAVVGLEDKYTDWAADFQVDRTLFRKDVLSLRGTYIRENSTLAATYAAMGAQVSNHHLDTVFANAEYHFGNRLSGTVGWFDTGGLSTPCCMRRVR